MARDKWGPYDLTGKAAIVTGGAMGIGYGCCVRLREAGADVLLADINAEAAEAAAKNLAGEEGGGAVDWITVDVAEADQLQAMVDRCVERFGRLDVLVNNAGIFPFCPIVDVTPEFVRRLVRVNLESVILATAAAGKRMIELGNGGAIINMTSRDAFQPFAVGLGTYGATKGAVATFTKHSALEFAPHGIRAVAVAPGAVATEGAAAGAMSSGMSEAELMALQERSMSRQPLGRMAVADDIATVVAFLASDAARFITGDTVLADGGMLLL